MSQTGVVSWSQTAATNATADSTINMAEGMAPSAVNDGVRALMASGAKYRDDTAGSLLTSGTSTAYTVTSNQDFSSLTVLHGQELKVRFHTANGASATLSVDSLTAAQLRIDNSNAVAAASIPANSIWSVTYDNTIPAFILQSGTMLLDSSVTTTKIVDANVTTGKLADAAVTTAKITDANVTYAKIQNVTNGKVLGNFSGPAAAPSEYSPNQILPRLHVQETQLQNTASSNAPTVGAWRTVVLNTVVVNEIPGASLSANVTTLAAGGYRVRASYSLNYGNLGNAQLRLQNTTDNALLATGLPLSGTAGQNFENGAPLTLEGSFILAASKTVELQIQVNVSVAGRAAVNFGTEVYVNLIFEKIS